MNRFDPITSYTKLILVEAAAAAGTTALTSDVVDTAGWAGCVFFASAGAITADGVQSMKVQQGAAADMSDAADLLGSSIAIADNDDGQTFAIDINQPKERYLRAVISRATQNSVFSPIYALLYGPRTKPTSWAATDLVTVETHVSPAEGTA